MLYIIAFEFKESDKVPDEKFFNLLDSIGNNILCLDGLVLLDAAYLAKGIMEEMQRYFDDNNGFVIVSRITKDIAAKLRDSSRKFLKQHWNRIPEIGDLGKLPEAQ